MKLNKSLIAMLAGASFGLSGQVMAGGTPADTDITNTVTLDYSVSSTPQTAVQSQAAFKVDNKVDMTITSDTPTADTAPGETVVLAYTVTNTGNKVQSYVMSVADNGNTDWTPQSFAFFSDASASTALANNKIVDLAIDDSITVYAEVEMPQTTVADGDTVELVATATALDPADTDGLTLLTQDATADKNANLTEEYVVFADAETTPDAAQNGRVTALTSRNIVTAEFTDPNDANAVPTLAVEIINDIICDSALASASNTDYSVGSANAGTCPDALATDYAPKAIPTSMARFTYSAENSGAATANEVVFSEQLPSEYDAASLNNATLSVGGTSQTLTVVTDAPDAANEVRYDGTTGTITIYVGDVDASEVVDITYTAIVE
ncbi:hypothetical protein [Bermanella sp. R86510]|uniref:hypothetical protein n=1 Tax=unclassified Bermanella TaxID=2627862 RepID=UPI0037C70A0C